VSKKMLVVFAHPDDETVVSGTIAMAVEKGWRVQLVSATRGEAGEINVPGLATRETLGDAREKELLCACSVLGIEKVHFLDYCDSGMAGSPENRRASSYINASENEVVAKLLSIIKEFTPDIIITFEPYGIYGHPDHIAVSKHTTAAFHESGANGILMYSGVPSSWFPKFEAYLRVHGFLGEGESRPQFPIKPYFDGTVSHTHDVHKYIKSKQDSARCHQSQIKPGNFFHIMLHETGREIFAEECLSQVYPKMENTSSSNTLF